MARPHAILALSIAATRTEASIALPRFREFRRTVLETLREAVREGEGPPMGIGAYYVGLGLLEDVDSLPRLRDAVRHRAIEGPRVHACEAIGLIGRAVPTAIDPLREVLDEKGASAALLEAAAKALGRLGGVDGSAALHRQVESGGADHRISAAVLALGWTGRPEAVRTLVRMVRDPRTSDSVRAVACTALGMLADPGPLPAASVLAPGLADLPWTGGLAAAFATL
jgi:HEAT repeat protein